jgi:hypothetical protein|tara:strand:+ start:2215 stop:2406 length:192 start_codon:yes stop_codon:yes gene_type:complete
MKVGDLVRVINYDEPWRENQFAGQLGVIIKVNEKIIVDDVAAHVLLTSNDEHWFSCGDLEVQE